jgi:hypothetical protein
MSDLQQAYENQGPGARLIPTVGDITTHDLVNASEENYFSMRESTLNFQSLDLFDNISIILYFLQTNTNLLHLRVPPRTCNKQAFFFKPLFCPGLKELSICIPVQQ